MARTTVLGQVGGGEGRSRGRAGWVAGARGAASLERSRRGERGRPWGVGCGLWTRAHWSSGGLTVSCGYHSRTLGDGCLLGLSLLSSSTKEDKIGPRLGDDGGDGLPAGLVPHGHRGLGGGGCAEIRRLRGSLVLRAELDGDVCPPGFVEQARSRAVFQGRLREKQHLPVENGTASGDTLAPRGPPVPFLPRL